MSDTSFFTSAANSPLLPIVAGLFRGLVGISSGLGFAWAAGVTGDQLMMAAMAVIAIGMLGWSTWQKVSAFWDARRAAVAAAKASVELGTPVTVTVTPKGMPNEAVRVSPVEAGAAPSVPLDVQPSPAPRAA